MAARKIKSTPKTLASLNYATFEGDFGDAVSPRWKKHEGKRVQVYEGSVKYHFLRNCKSFVDEVTRLLPGLIGKSHSNPGGPGVPGNISFTGEVAGRVFFLSTAMLDGRTTTLFWRLGTRPYAVDGANQWIEDGGLHPVDVAARIMGVSGWHGDLGLVMATKEAEGHD